MPLRPVKVSRGDGEECIHVCVDGCVSDLLQAADKAPEEAGVPEASFERVSSTDFVDKPELGTAARRGRGGCRRGKVGPLASRGEDGRREWYQLRQFP
jgi:hypothetical protein